MKYEEFRKLVQKASSPRQTKVSGSWGVYDAYKMIRKDKWEDTGRPLKEHEFYSIIREVNNLLAAEIVQGREIHFPSRMGKLELRKRESGVRLVEGKLRNTYPVDWDRTVRLWYEDEEARKDKTLLRNEDGTVYFVKYNKYNANYRNKEFYLFALNRKIKRALHDNIEKGVITDTLW